LKQQTVRNLLITQFETVGGRPTLEEFQVMAKRGRIHLSDDDTVTPSKAELERAKTPIDLGRVYGYSEDDIAHFYLVRFRGQVDQAYCQYISHLYQKNIDDEEQILRSM
jgi:hypothetical protein